MVASLPALSSVCTLRITSLSLNTVPSVRTNVHMRGQRVVEAIGVASAPGDLVSDVGEEVLRRRGQASTGHGGFGVAALGLDEGVDHGPVVLWETEHVGDRVARDGRGPLRSDFRQLAFLHGPPPKAIWLRVGNVTTNDIHRLLADSYDTIEHFYADEDEALLVLDIR